MLKTSLIVLLVVTVTSASAAPYELEKSAGSWKTWTAADVAVPPPPDAAASKREIAELIAQSEPDDAAMARIRYWDAGAPGYRWNQIAYEMAKESDIPAERVYALLNVAIHDATIVTWRAKYEHRRARPSDASPRVRRFLDADDSPSYPSEHAAAAGAAAAVLAYLFPNHGARVEASAEESGRSRVAAGVHFPSDVRAGLALGRAVGAHVIKWAREDGSSETWKGTVPSGAGLWNGTNPYNPAIANWRTWVISTPSQFRPPAPPAFDDAALAEVKDPANITGSRKRAAFYWALTSLSKHWIEQASLEMFERRIDRNPPRAARIYAVLSTAYYDALVACWDAKFAYWGIRPHQFDPTFKSMITTPNFPGYPSGHAVFAGAATRILATFFPEDAAAFEAQAEEAASSRLWAGVHFRVDNEVGLKLGRAVAEAALRRAVRDAGSLTTR